MRFIRGILSLFLALFLVVVCVQWSVHPTRNPAEGQVLLYDLPGENAFFHLAAKSTGLALLEPTGRLVVGWLLLLVSALLIVQPLRRVGAGLALILFAALVGMQTLPFLPQDLPETVSSERTDGMARYYLNLACLTASFLLLFVHPKKIRQPYSRSNR